MRELSTLGSDVCREPLLIGRDGWVSRWQQRPSEVVPLREVWTAGSRTHQQRSSERACGGHQEQARHHRPTASVNTRNRERASEAADCDQKREGERERERVSSGSVRCGSPPPDVPLSHGHTRVTECMC